jgi:hypothetical protein
MGSQTTAPIRSASLTSCHLIVSIGYQQNSQTAQSIQILDAAHSFRVPHDRRYLFILHSDTESFSSQHEGGGFTVCGACVPRFIAVSDYD